MATVIPKLLYSGRSNRDISVWEISSKGGRKIYYERKHHPGYLPVGRVD